MITKDWESEPTNTDALDALRVNRSDKKIDYAKVQSLLLSCDGSCTRPGGCGCPRRDPPAGSGRLNEQFHVTVRR